MDDRNLLPYHKICRPCIHMLPGCPFIDTEERYMVSDNYDIGMSIVA